uniref:Uncharacterized protein n=1 Tax=Pipistrellus kuhlii TaxID=59472 RepID=A0A7J8A850_PIPKU|nr:hypothetical protein mPipKuh1_008842 [Pipistrellus kuhlii]
MSHGLHVYSLSRNKSTFETIREVKADYLELIHNLLFILSHTKLGFRHRGQVKIKASISGLFFEVYFHNFIYITLHRYICTYTQFRKRRLAYTHGNYQWNLEIMILSICRIYENFFRYHRS